MEYHILVKYASRSRPGRFLEGLKSIFELAASPRDITVYCTFDSDDPNYEEYFELMGSNHPWNVMTRSTFGRSACKIDAINRDLHLLSDQDILSKWDILVNFSDDMRFIVYGWDQLIREGLRCNGPDVFLHYPDSTARQMLSTMSVMDRKYFERDGYIYHPSYKSLFCDNEAMEVAQLRGRYRYMGIQIFDHFHPAYGHVEWDKQYLEQQAFWNEDEVNYKYRKANNFFLNGLGNLEPPPAI